MQGFAMWSVLTFLLNATLFILIGLQLPVIVDGLSGRPAGEVVGYAAAVCAAVIAVRFLWTFIVTFLIRAIDRRPSQRARRASWRTRVVGSWAGMRGAVSLAAALALPLHTDAGAPLPGRDLIQFITFALILVTVVGEGLTLPWLIRRLGVVEDGTEEENEEIRARLVIARAALERVDELEGEDWTRDGTIERVRQPLQVPPAPLQGPGGEDRGRGRDRGALARLPAADARDLRGPARGARPASQQPRDQRRCDAPGRARARPGGVAAGGLAGRLALPSRPSPWRSEGQRERARSNRWGRAIMVSVPAVML